MTDTEKAALEARIDELRQENEQLRQELAIRESSEQEKVIDYLGKECADWEVQYLALAAENAMLRELVADLWEYIYIGTAQDGQRLHDRTRELGVEVDG